MKRKGIIIFSVVCIILVLFSIGIVVRLQSRIEPNPVGTVGNTAGNLYNGGVFCENDGYVYFSNPHDGNALYRMLPDETEQEKLIATEIGSINAAGDYIYFYQKGSGSGEGFGYVFDSTGVFRAEKKNPKRITCLDQIRGSHLVLADNTLYYNTISSADGDSLKKVDMDGENMEVLLKAPVTPACIDRSTLYFANADGNNHLMSLSAGSKNAAAFLAEDVYMPIVDGSTIYYIDMHNNYALASFDSLTGTKTFLTREWVDTYNISDSYIYYQTAGDAPQLKRMSKDGTFSEAVADGAYYNISLTSQYAYFTKFGTDRPIYKTPVNGAVFVSTLQATPQAGF